MSTPPPPPRRPSTVTPPRPSKVLPGASDKPLGTRSLVEQIVAEQKQQKVELKDAIERKKKRFPLAPIAAVLLVVGNIVAWLIIPPTHDTSGTRRNSLEIERDLRLVIASAASEVDIWRRLNENKMPSRLSDVGVADSGLVLVRVDDVVYEIRGVDHGVKLSYRSNTPITDFMDAGIPSAPVKK